LETKPSPKLNDRALTWEIMALFKQDLSPDQISGRLGALYPGRKEKQVSPFTMLHRYLPGNGAGPWTEKTFQAKTGKTMPSEGEKERRGQIPDRVSIDERRTSENC
jgi:IS30 family transposase